MSRSLKKGPFIHQGLLKKIEEMSKWMKLNLGENTPLHFSRFFPYYKLLNARITPASTLEKATLIAKKYLKFVYIGNLSTDKDGNTYCPKCKKMLIERSFFSINQESIKNGKCKKCKEKIPGIWS